MQQQNIYNIAYKVHAEKIASGLLCVDDVKKLHVDVINCELYELYLGNMLHGVIMHMIAPSLNFMTQPLTADQTAEFIRVIDYLLLPESGCNILLKDYYNEFCYEIYLTVKNENPFLKKEDIWRLFQKLYVASVARTLTLIMMVTAKIIIPVLALYEHNKQTRASIIIQRMYRDMYWRPYGTGYKKLQFMFNTGIKALLPMRH